MNDTVGPQLVLRCAQCNKPFDKESTLKRHGYYCRSKKTGPVPRVRSCGSCAKLKAACDKRRPKCSRCATKGLSCHYPVKAAANTNSTSRKYSNIDHQVTLVTPSAAGSPPVTSEMIGQESSNDSAVAFDNVPFPDIDFSSLGDNPLDWQLGGTDDLTGFWDENMNIQTFQANQSSNSTTPGSHDSVPLTDRDIQSYAPLPVSIPRTPGPGIRSLVPRTKTKTHAQRIANLILQTVRSYPLTILNNNGLPPFIHPSLITPGVDNPDMEPLTNCISLVRMLNNGFQGSRKLFWKNVRLECERLCEPLEVGNPNKWELMASMQALCIYILMRLDEGQTEYNNCDALLVRSVVAICTHFAKCRSWPKSGNLMNAWKEWIFQESARRTCVIFRIINLLIFFEPATMCDMNPDLIIAPLPAKRQLWQASDEVTWKAACENDPTYQIRYALASDGELVKLDQEPVQCCDVVGYNGHWDERPITRKVVDWKEWCAGMDDFGGLVMLAASFVV